MLTVPPHIRAAAIATGEVRYRWDEWNVQDHYMIVDEDEFARFDALTNKACTGLTIAIGEWICARFSSISADPAPLMFLEAAWAGVVYPPYCIFTETVDDEWRGPVRGPLAITMVLANDALFHLSSDPKVATRVCWMLGLARHVLPSSVALHDWLEPVVRRLETFHSKAAEGITDPGTDLFEDFPGQGSPVPRQAFDLTVPYDPAEGPQLLDAFLRALDPASNPYLRSGAEIVKYGDLSGPPYRFLP